MKVPWLIQRCELSEGKLVYDYMGSTEFEVGDQAKALKRIFAVGVTLGSATVNIGGKTLPVYMVAGEGFTFDNYQPYLQQLADHKLQLQEWTSFDDVANAKAGLKAASSYALRTNAWFDFENDVLWTLTESDQKELVAVLERIKNKWADKK